VSSILAAPAHKHVAPLGRNTAKLIAQEVTSPYRSTSLPSALARPCRPPAQPRLPPSLGPKLPPNSREPSACPPQFKTDGSVLALLKLLDSAKRPRVLELVDAGQRARRAAECYTVG